MFDIAEVAEALVPRGAANSRNVNLRICRLRGKLAPFGDAAPRIVTVRGVGYMLDERLLSGRSDPERAV